MSEALITVIMPLKYYHPEFLRKAVASITQQSSPSWNLVIVVEQADVDTFRTLFAKELNDPRIAVLVNHGFGFPGAINSGVAHATTTFVAILLADDMWSNDAVETLNQYIAKYPEVDFFHSSRVVVDEHDAPISSIGLSKETFSLSEFKRGSPVKHLLCWRREKGLAVGGIDESMLKAQDDYDFPWTMAERGATFKAVKECLYYYRNHLECERLTTHRPLSTTRRAIREILRKHGVGYVSRHLIVARMRRRGSLGSQCIYRNPIDRWLKRKVGHDAKRVWRQPTYR